MSDREKKPIWPEEAQRDLLHIIPQGSYHEDATIYGDPDALRRLGVALIAAAETGQDWRLTRLMVADGEGYHVLICPRDQWQMDEAPLPYAQLGHPWDVDCAALSDQPRQHMPEGEHGDDQPRNQE